MPDLHFADQVSLIVYLTDIFYIVSIGSVMLSLLAVLLIDLGLVRTENQIDTIIQRVLSMLTGGMAFMIIGYAIWNLQFYQAFGDRDAVWNSLNDWWIGGQKLTSPSYRLDPAATSQADVQQIFVAFFFSFGALVGAFIHGAGLERMKPQATVANAAIAGGIGMPVLSYLTWGPTSFLTNAGLHDFVGAISLYLFVGIWALILAWRLGSRRNRAHKPRNFLLVGTGSILLMALLPVLVIGCGSLVPGSGFFSVTGVEAGLGLVFTNVLMALGGGLIGGAWLGYAQRNAICVLLGPIAGHICCSALYDLIVPWQAFLIALPGPFLFQIGYKIVERLGIDEPKVAPLTIGPALYSVMMVGIVGAGTPSGGLAGVASGPYAFHHAEISLWTQMTGVGLLVPLIAAFAAIVVFPLDYAGLLRVTADAEESGLDVAYWTEVKVPEAVSPPG